MHHVNADVLAIAYAERRSEQDLSTREEQAQEAAYLYAQRFSQQQLAEIFNCSQSNISRLLKIAQERRWLRTEIRFDDRGIPAKRLDEIRRLMEPKRLAISLGRLQTETRLQVRSLRVYPSGSGDFDERLIRFGRLAAGRVLELIAESSVVGIHFGETLHRLVDGLEWSGLQARDRGSMLVTPVAGEVASYERIGSSSTWLANRLHGLVTARGAPPAYSLAAVPFFIPRKFDAGKVRAIREWVEELPSYRRVFGGHRSIVSRIDCLITSIGQDGKPLALASAELEEACGITRQEVNELVLAEIGGALIPRERITNDQQVELADLEASMIGLKLDDIRRIAEQAADPSRPKADQLPGVCVVAIGKNKARSLLTVLREGLVNELIVDDELAIELEHLLGKGRGEH
jgi:DNA-binding transcriptional regulator LsrR (DeoR family)